MAIAARADHSSDGVEAQMKLNQDRSRTSERVDPLGPNSEIGRKLKQYYDELVTEEVPDRFADLLKQLEERQSRDSTRNGD